MSRRAAAVLIGVLALAFGVSQFFRTVIAVIAPELRRELGLGSDDLGLVSGAYFFAFALMHLPVGALLDRFGPRRTMSVFLVAAAAGSAVFAAAQGPVLLIAGMALIGVGCSPAFVGGLAVLARWYGSDRLGALGALLTALSAVGTIGSGTPFAALAEAIGWRASFLVMAGVALAAAALVWRLVRDAPDGHEFHARAPEPMRDVLRGFGEILGRVQIWGIVAMTFVSYAASVAIRGLWGGPYLADLFGLDAIARGNVLLAMSVAGMVGAFAYGWLEWRGVARTRLVGLGAASVAACFALLAAVPMPGWGAATAVFLVIGLVGPFSILLIAHARSLFADRLTGRAMTSVNVANFFGVFVLQAGTGWVLAAFEPENGHPPESGYRAVFAVLGAAVIVSAAIFWRWGRGRR